MPQLPQGRNSHHLLLTIFTINFPTPLLSSPTLRFSLYPVVGEVGSLVYRSMETLYLSILMISPRS